MKTHHWFLLASVALLFSSCSSSELHPIIPSTTDDTSGILLDRVDVYVEYTSAKVFGSIAVNQKPERISRVDVLYGDSATDLSKTASGSFNTQDGFNVNLDLLEDGVKYFYRVDIIVGKSSIKGDINSFITFPRGPVDLDLPSGTKWTSANLGAAIPTDSGAHYAWGETLEKSRYDWTTYKYCKEGGEKLTKYFYEDRYNGNYPNYADCLDELLPEDDAATVILGESYITPSYNEWGELWHCCELQTATINGVSGIIFSSKKDINNYKKYIFLSCETGYYDGIQLKSGAYYWLSWKDSSDSKYAYRFCTSEPLVGTMKSNLRANGLVIRPVYLKQNN